MRTRGDKLAKTSGAHSTNFSDTRARRSPQAAAVADSLRMYAPILGVWLDFVPKTARKQRARIAESRRHDRRRRVEWIRRLAKKRFFSIVLLSIKPARFPRSRSYRRCLSTSGEKKSRIRAYESKSWMLMRPTIA